MLRYAALIGAALSLSCAHAGRERVQGGARVFEAPGMFRIGAPGPKWELHRNRRIGRRLLMDYRRGNEDVDLRVTVHPLDAETRRVPLPVLAEGMVLNFGRERELETEVLALQRVDFGRHEGMVVHAKRHWRNRVVRLFSQAFVRTGDWMVMLTYTAPPELYEKYAAEYAHAVERFAILPPPDPPVYGLTLPDDLPQAPPPPSDDPLPVSTPPPPAP